MMFLDPSSARRSACPTVPPLKTSLSTNPKRRSDKRVRFALELNTIIAPDRESSASSRTPRRVVDPWQQPGPLNDAYNEYLRKHEPPTISETDILCVSPLDSVSNQQLPAQSSSYTHTYVVPHKPVESNANAPATNAQPTQAFPQIVQQSTKIPRRPLPTIDSYLKQQLNITTPPRILRTRKPTTPSEGQARYVSVHAILKQLENSPSSPSSSSESIDSRSSGRSIRAESFFQSKPHADHVQRAKINQLMNKSLSNGYHQMNPMPMERPILPNYFPRARLPTHSTRIVDGVYINPFAVPSTHQYRASFLPTILDPTR